MRALVILIAGNLLASASFAQSNPTAQQGTAANPPPATTAKSAAKTPATAKATALRQVKVTEKAKNYYVAAWGVDKLRVTYTASGNLIRFTYRVVEPERAKVLNDKKSTPYLVGQRSRAVLQVPVMDKVGPLRQSMGTKAGEEYWMVFSNKGNLVRAGDRVNVVVGAFHADGLMVE